MMGLGFRKSLYLLAGVAGLSLLLATLAGLWQAHVAGSVAERIYLERTAPAMDLMKAVDALHRARQTILIALSEENDDAAQVQLKKIAAFDQSMKSALQAYKEAARDQQTNMLALESRIADYNKARDQSVKMIEIGDRPSALENIKSNAGPKFDKVLASLSDVIQAQAELARKDHENANADLRSGGIAQIVLALLTLAGMAALFVWITRRILKQLGGEPADAVDVARRIAAGDLNTPIPLAAGDTDSMMASMKSMQDSLADLIKDIQHVVATAVAGDLSQRVALANREGFSRDIGTSLNQLLQTADTSLADIVRVSGALARGDLSQNIDRQYPGSFGQTAAAVTATVSALSKAIDGVRRVVHVSALGVGPGAPSNYLRSKTEGEAALCTPAVDATLLRPSVIFGAEDRFLNLFATLQAVAPVLPLAGSSARFQPVWVDDVASAIVACVDDAATIGQTFECTGPTVYTLSQLVLRAGRWSGHDRPQFPLPTALAKLQALAMEWLPGEPLMSRDNVDSMAVPNVASGKLPGLAALGISATALEAVAPGYLGGQQACSRLDSLRKLAGRK